MGYPLKVLNAKADNSCGTCTACCDIIGVQELGKPYYARCVHLKEGCAVYPNRPGTCRGYRCIWHLGLLGDKTERRPDNLGVMFQIEPEPPFGNVLALPEAVHFGR
jgi:Fe-S-cluster containining protein